MHQSLFDLLSGTDARCANAELVRNAPLGREQGTGDAVRFRWREDFAAWIADAAKLVLDATTREEVVRAWVPDLEVVDIEVEAPHQRVRQVIGREFGRAFFAENPGNVARLADLVMLDLARSGSQVLVVAQVAVEEALRAEIRRRLDGRIPNRLALAHHGAVTGLDGFRDVERLIVVGRPATDRKAGERLAELVKGGAVEVVAAAEDTRWPTATAGLHTADGRGVPVRQPHHPDPLVEPAATPTIPILI